MRLYEYPGALHIHSTHSDGSATIPHIAAIAQRAGLSWIIISDHDTRAGALNREEGWYDGTAVMVGYEITPEHSHFLVLGLEEVLPASMPPAEFVAAVRDRGGWGFVLHPDEQAGSYFKPPYPWKDRSIRGFDGIEIWNYMSEWTEGITTQNRYLRFAFPILAVYGPTEGTMAWWDELLASGERVSAVVGLDTHATRYMLFGRFPVEVFPYRRQFGTLINYVVLRKPLSQEWNEAVQQIGGALAQGHSYMAYQAWGKGRGFRFLAEREGESWTIGEEIPPGREVRLMVHSPRWGQIRLVHNGRVIRRSWGSRMKMTVQDPGAYRIEISRFGRPWLYSNPIYLVQPGRVSTEKRRWVPQAPRPWA
jgi:hypothetical protein